MKKPPNTAALIEALQPVITLFIAHLSEIENEIGDLCQNLLLNDPLELDTTHHELEQAKINIESAVKHLGTALGVYISDHVSEQTFRKHDTKPAEASKKKAGAK